MFKLILTIVVLIITCAILIKCAVFEVHINEMSEEDRVLALGLAEAEFKNNRTDNLIAKKLADDFNTFYGEKWLCFVGTKGIDSVIAQLDIVSHTLLWFSYDSKHVVLFKTKLSNSTQIQQTFSDIIAASQRSNIKPIMHYSSDEKLCKDVYSIINSSLADFQTSLNCTENLSISNRDQSFCYYKLAAIINNNLIDKLGNRWSVVIELLKFGSSFTTERCYINYCDIIFGNVIEFIVAEYL